MEDSNVKKIQPLAYVALKRMARASREDDSCHQRGRSTIRRLKFAETVARDCERASTLLYNETSPYPSADRFRDSREFENNFVRNTILSKDSLLLGTRFIRGCPIFQPFSLLFPNGNFHNLEILLFNF